MKIRLLSLILIIMGILATSGCVDSQAQPSTSIVSEDLYRSILYPYVGLLNKGDYEIFGVHMGRGPLPGMPYEGQGSAHSLRNATFMLDENIKKAEIISARLDTGTQYLKEEGKDVTRLEFLLEEFNDLVEEAKHYQTLAASSTSSEENISSRTNEASEDGLTVENAEMEYLIQSQKSMIRANLVLKDIFNEFNRLRHGNVVLNETSRLGAEGEGRVVLMGGFDLNLHLQEGNMVVIDLSPDSTIQIVGDYTLERRDGRQGNALKENALIYHIQSVDAEISGSHKMLLLSGKNITVEADGKGHATFFGNGTYIIEDAGGIKKEEQWAVDSFFNEEMGPVEPRRMENKIAVVGPYMVRKLG